jgi:hypothetical protein
LSRARNIALGLALLVLAGCNFNYDSPSGIQGVASQTGSAASTSSGTGSGTAELAWEIPTENTNGTPLTDLAGYTIVYGPSPSDMDHWVPLADIGTTSYVVKGLGQGTWYFAILSYTLSGANSPLSNIASKTIS